VLYGLVTIFGLTQPNWRSAAAQLLSAFGRGLPVTSHIPAEPHRPNGCGFSQLHPNSFLARAGLNHNLFPDLDNLCVSCTVLFRPQVQSRVTRDPGLNLCAKSSWSWAAHKHATKQDAYLLSLNWILILIFCRLQWACYECHALRCHFCIIHKLPYGSLVIIYEPWTWKISVIDHTGLWTHELRYSRCHRSHPVNLWLK
jgi:hypothetical protein